MPKRVNGGEPPRAKAKKKAKTRAVKKTPSKAQPKAKKQSKARAIQPPPPLDIEPPTTSLVANGPSSKLRLGLFQERIVSYLVPYHREDRLYRVSLDTSVSRKALESFRFVNRQWNKVAKHEVAKYKAWLFTADFGWGQKSHYDSVMRRLQTTYPDVHQLRIRVGGRYWLLPPGEYSPPSAVMRKADWEEVFAAFPNLVRLEMPRMCLSLMFSILPVVSRMCPKLKALVLPADAPSKYETRSGKDWKPVKYEITDVVITALRQWYQSNGGLASLYISVMPSDRVGKYDELLDAITRYCPRIRILEGEYIDPYDTDRLDRSDILGNSVSLADVNEPVWAKFCATCTQLEAFSWRNAPLKQVFIQHFASTVRPALHTLKICDYPLSRSSTCDLRVIQTMLAAVPALKVLELSLSEKVVGSLEMFTTVAITKCPQLERFDSYILSRHGNMAALTTGGFSTLCQGRSVTDIRVSREFIMNGPELVCSLQTMTENGTPKTRKLYLEADEVPYRAIIQLLQYLIIR